MRAARRRQKGAVRRQTRLLTTTEAAELLGVTRDGVYKLVTRGKLRAMRHGNAYAFERADVAQARRHPRPGRPAAKPERKRSR